MKAVTKAMALGWAVFPGAHTLKSDIIGENIADWNDQARRLQERLEQENQSEQRERREY